MKRIALVSVTLNAVNPIVDYMTKTNPDVHVVNYLDSYLLEKVGKDNGVITDESMGRMFDMLVKACADGAQCIIMTCTIFSPYAEKFSELLSVPIICPDGAMLDGVAKEGGKTAIICTFTGTVDTTRSVFFKYQRLNGRAESVDMHVVPEAFKAAQVSDMETHDRVIREKVAELDASYDHVVLAQISMARAAQGVAMKHAKLWTSPKSAVEAAVNLLK